MKKTIAFFLRDSRYTVFHIFSLAFFFFGFFVAITATELGPFAPILVSSGIYLVMFSVVLELMFWFKVLLRRILRPWMTT
jgi:hypothetical protein